MFIGARDLAPARSGKSETAGSLESRQRRYRFGLPPALWKNLRIVQSTYARRYVRRASDGFSASTQPGLDCRAREASWRSSRFSRLRSVSFMDCSVYADFYGVAAVAPRPCYHPAGTACPRVHVPSSVAPPRHVQRTNNLGLDEEAATTSGVQLFSFLDAMICTMGATWCWWCLAPRPDRGRAKVKRTPKRRKCLRPSVRRWSGAAAGRTRRQDRIATGRRAAQAQPHRRPRHRPCARICGEFKLAAAELGDSAPPTPKRPGSTPKRSKHSRRNWCWPKIWRSPSAAADSRPTTASCLIEAEHDAPSSHHRVPG